MRKMTKRSAIITTTAVLAVGVGAAAWAVNGWTINGTGKGEAQASEIIDLTAEAKVDKPIYPGLKTTIAMTVDNKNDFPVQITSDITPTRFTVEPATPGCALTPAAVKGSDFPGPKPVISAKKKETIQSNIEIGDLPQACAGKKLKIEYNFKALSTVAS